MKATVETVDHNTQRYDTCGDWIWDNGTLHVSVSETGNEDFNFLIAIHEMIEAYGCATNGIAEEDVTAFDVAFSGDGEPGDDPRAPYYPHHRIASEVERYLAALMRVDWKEYEAAIARLGK